MEHCVRNRFNMSHFIWRICKNNIVLRFANSQEMKSIFTNNPDLGKIQLLGHMTDENHMAVIHFHSMNIRASTRSKFVTDTAGSRKQVKNIDTFKIKLIG